MVVSGGDWKIYDGGNPVIKKTEKAQMKTEAALKFVLFSNIKNRDRVEWYLLLYLYNEYVTAVRNAATVRTKTTIRLQCRIAKNGGSGKDLGVFNYYSYEALFVASSTVFTPYLGCAPVLRSIL